MRSSLKQRSSTSRKAGTPPLISLEWKGTSMPGSGIVACEREQQHVVILVRNKGLSQLDTNMWYSWYEIRRRRRSWTGLAAPQLHLPRLRLRRLRGRDLLRHKRGHVRALALRRGGVDGVADAAERQQVAVLARDGVLLVAQVEVDDLQQAACEGTNM